MKKGTRTTHSNAQKGKKIAKKKERERGELEVEESCISKTQATQHERTGTTNKQTDEFRYSIDLTFGGRR